ncbi:MAG: heme ABC transporter permease CcmB [Rhodothermales bacterium]|nr:heme ABC transporter permease CcmB [Rhodothermales bacterium]
MAFVRGALAILGKDIRLELRSRVGINSLILFVVTALFIAFFGIGQAPVTPRVESALLWIVVLFAAALGLGRTFVAEEEQQTALLLKLNATPLAIYTGKLLFNFLLLAIVNLLAAGIFVVLLSKSVSNPGLLLVIVLGGALALAGATTLLSALVVHGGGVGLLPVLLFPLLLPLMGALVNATRLCLADTPIVSIGGVLGENLTTIFAFAGVTITASVMLFDQVWND